MGLNLISGSVSALVLHVQVMRDDDVEEVSAEGPTKQKTDDAAAEDRMKSRLNGDRDEPEEEGDEQDQFDDAEDDVGQHERRLVVERAGDEGDVAGQFEAGADHKHYGQGINEAQIVDLEQPRERRQNGDGEDEADPGEDEGAGAEAATAALIQTFHVAKYFRSSI